MGSRTTDSVYQTGWRSIGLLHRPRFVMIMAIMVTVTITITMEKMIKKMKIMENRKQWRDQK
jgi:hypothetical protein